MPEDVEVLLRALKKMSDLLLEATIKIREASRVALDTIDTVERSIKDARH